MDFYFTDRKFNLIEIASTDGQAPYQLSAAPDFQSVKAAARTLSGTLIFTREQANRINQMAALGNYVLYHDKFGKDRFTTIMDIRHDPLNGTRDFTAEDAGVDLINETVGAYTADKAYNIAYYINKFTYDSGFEIGTNEISTLSRKLKWDSTDETSLARILSVATQFDAELDFSFEISGTNVVKRYINIYKHRGADNQVRLYLDKDINNIVTTGDIYDLYTSVYATGGTPEGSDKPITLKGYKWTDPDGRYELGADGILRDTVAVQLWSRILSNDNPNPAKHHLQRSKSYEASTQASLLQSALGGLKKAVNPAVNYEVDIAVLPENIEIGDTVHIVDDNEDLYLSARVLELKYDYALEQYTATLGDYLIEVSTVDEKLKELADDVKNMPKSVQYYPWVRYADDADGNGFSMFPQDKAYMAIVFGKVSTPSDNPSDYAGKWVKILGDDGTDGLEGPAGADGKTTYFHKAYANSSDGKTDFSITDPANKAYLGTCSDFTKADPTDPTKYLWQLVKGDKGDKGNDGLPGKDGVGLATTTVSYQASTSGTTVPSGTWSTNVPTVTKGQYLWTKTTWTYSDNTTEDGYSVSYIAKDGSSGSDGLPGKDGTGIKSTVIEYAVSSSGVTKPTTGWSTAIPSVAAGQFMWTRTTWSYTDGSNETGYSVAKAGETGPAGKDGAQGTPGKAGADGKTPYLHISYATSADGSAGFSTTDSTNKTYIGQYTDFTEKDSTAASDYQWTKIKGDKGDKGDTGADGKPGKDGLGIKESIIAYQLGTSGTTAPTGTWSATVPTLIKGKYLWTRTTLTYTDNTSEPVYSVTYIAKDGNDGSDGVAGKDGVGIKSTSITYASSTSGTIAPTSGWTANPPATSAGHYIWTKTVWTYTDGTSEIGYSVGKIGEKGEDGADGADGKTLYFHVAYADSADGKDGFYVSGGRNLIKNSDAISSWVGEHNITKNDGAFVYMQSPFVPAMYQIEARAIDDSVIGADFGWQWNSQLQGESIKLSKDWQKATALLEYNYSIGLRVIGGLGLIELRFIKAEKGSVATPYSPAPEDVHPTYMGTYTDFTQSDSLDPTVYSWTLFKGKDGKDGNNGTDGVAGKDGVGIKSTTITYAVSASGTTKPTTGWETTIPSVTAGQYLWTKMVWSYTDGTSETGYSVAKAGETGPAGKDGAQGTPGKAGADGKTPYFHQAWADSSDGKTNFSTTVSLGKKYLGTYTDFTVADSTDPTRYKWVELAGAVEQHVDDAINNLIPPPSSGISYPSNPKKGQQHWLTDANGKPKGLFQYDGSKWVAVPVNADTISANTLNGMTINGVTINGSTINSPNINVPFDNVPTNPNEPEGSPFATFVSGTTKLTSNLNISGNITDGTNTTPQWVKTLVSSQGFSNVISTPDASKALSVVQVSLGSMFLSEWHSDVTANDGFVSSYLKAGDATTYEYVDVLAANDNIDEGTVRYTRKGSQVNVGFAFTLKNDTGWVALGKIRTGYTPNNMASVGVNCPSLSYRGYSCVVYPNNDGWRLIPTIGQGKGGFQGSISYVTYDDYPYNDAVH